MQFDTVRRRERRFVFGEDVSFRNQSEISLVVYRLIMIGYDTKDREKIPCPPRDLYWVSG
jgi:hypothetical protein